MLMFYRIINSLLVLSLIFISVSCKENTIQPEMFGSITGFILSQDDSKPVDGASITTTPPSNAIVSGKDGKFSFNELPVGNYTVNVSKKGYKKSSVSVSVKEGQTANATIFLESDQGNTAPNVPTNPVPANEATGQSVSLTLSWSASDPDKEDSLMYDIYLYESNSPSPVKVAADYPDTNYVVENLNYNTTYFWQIVAKDTANSETNGSVWTFKTKEFPDNPIVYAAMINDNYDIYSTNLSDSSEIRLTTKTSRQLWPKFNPNRTKIAYTSDENIQPQIFIMNRDGSGSYQVTSLPVTGYHNYGFGFAWSNDGGRLIYSNYDKLYSINQDGSALTLISGAPADRHFREVDYSPLGNKIAAVTIGSNVYDSEIYLMNPDGSALTLLVNNEPGLIESPSFSTDGTKILFTKDVSGFEGGNGRQLDAHIFLMSIDGSDTTDLSVNKPAGTNDLYPSFSPDGSKIIFTNAINDGSSPKEIWIMDANGNNRRKLETGEMPDWR
jgi:TolB protein